MATQKDTAELRQVFDAFDTNGNGTLELAEVVKAYAQMGENFTEEEVEKLFREVDKNFDGSISFAEFQAWYTHQQSGAKSGSMVNMKFKALNLLKKTQQANTRYGNLLEANSNERNVHVGFQVGEPEEISSGQLSLEVNNDAVETQFEAFSSGLEEFSAENPTFTLRIRSSNPDDAVGELEEKIEEVRMMLQQIPQAAMFLEQVQFVYGTDGDFVKMGVVCNVPMVTQMMQQVLGQIDNLQLSDSVSLEMNGCGDYSPETILQQNVGDINPQFKFNVDGTMKGRMATAFLMDVANRMAERKMSGEGFRNRHMEQMFAACVGALFSSANWDVKMNKADHKTIIGGTPMGGQMQQMQDAPVKDMISQFVPMATQMLSQAPPVVRGFLDMFYNNFESEGGFCVHAPKVFMSYSIKTSGFAQVYELFFPQ